MTIPEAAAREASTNEVAYPHASAEDKLRMIRDTVECQSPFGTELANFQRRLRLILDIA